MAEEEASGRKSRLDGGRKVPISMEITSSSLLLHGSLMAWQKERMALAPIILREGPHCQVR